MLDIFIKLDITTLYTFASFAKATETIARLRSLTLSAGSTSFNDDICETHSHIKLFLTTSLLDFETKIKRDAHTQFTNLHIINQVLGIDGREKKFERGNK